MVISEVSCDTVEGGLYIGPEFQLGQVYDGTLGKEGEAVVLYRPVYVCVGNQNRYLNSNASSKSSLNDNLDNKKIKIEWVIK